MGPLVVVLQVVDGHVDVLDYFVVSQRTHVLLDRRHLVVSQFGVGMLAVVKRGGNGNVTLGGVLVADLLDMASNTERFHDYDDSREVVS